MSCDRTIIAPTVLDSEDVATLQLTVRPLPPVAGQPPHTLLEPLRGHLVAHLYRDRQDAAPPVAASKTRACAEQWLRSKSLMPRFAYPKTLTRAPPPHNPSSGLWGGRKASYTL